MHKGTHARARNSKSKLAGDYSTATPFKSGPALVFARRLREVAVPALLHSDIGPARWETK